MRKLFVLVVAAAFILSAVGLSSAAMMAYRGTVTAVSGNKVTVKDDKGKSQTITVVGKYDWKVGDKVVVKDNKIISEDDWERINRPGAASAR